MRVHRGLPELPLSRFRVDGQQRCAGILGITFGSRRRTSFREAARRVPGATRAALTIGPACSRRCTRCWKRSGAAACPGHRDQQGHAHTMPVVGDCARAASPPSSLRRHHAHAKPHPAPLLEPRGASASRRRPACYVGDDERDVQAGRDAGMRTVAAAWGSGVGAVVPNGARRRDRSSGAALAMAGDALNYALPGPTWLRTRGFELNRGHAEHQFAHKSTGNKVTANDQRTHSPLNTGEPRNSWPMGWV